MDTGAQAEFSEPLLDWYQRNGRRDLPWKQPPGDYRVWVSEVMLQQTRVETVTGYFQRFMARFPDVESLAAAPLDSVLHLWSGLGYYARARNLHKTARIVCACHGGRLPRNPDVLQSLPGIGRSTAAAILAQTYGDRQIILDGNVKRVLARYGNIEGWPGRTAVAARLWTLAEELTPQSRIADYTQAIMDLGATVCTRTRPACHACPVAAGCAARTIGRTAELPTPRPRAMLPVRHTAMLVLVSAGREVLLERRPERGVWGGLWSLPELEPDGDPVAWCLGRTGQVPDRIDPWPPLRHTFSHFHLDIQPFELSLCRPPAVIMEGSRWVWYNVAQPDSLGIATPVSRLLCRLTQAVEGASP